MCIRDRGTRLVINSQQSTEWLEDREVGPEEYQLVQSPQEQAHDYVYILRPIADKEGNVQVALVNDELKLGIYWEFPIREMPIITQWQHFHKGTYVTGIEPGNVSMLGRAWNRKHGYLNYIQPSEIRDFHLEIGVLEGKEEINAFEHRIKQG